MLFCPNTFLFVHIQRTGGMSLRRALHRPFPEARQLISPHGRAIDALRSLGPRAFYRCYRFAFVRNPWDRLVSWYSMLREKDGPRRGTKPGWDRYRFEAARLPFADFLQKTAAFPFLGATFSFATNQVDYLIDASGTLLVDDVFRFESFQYGIDRINQRLGVALALSHRNSSRHDPYQTYYTAETRDLVAQRFARDIQAFGYSF